MKIVALFNNKGGVGKSTLGFHLGCALSEMKKKVLLVDLDPQCNLTISGYKEEDLHKIWEEEDDFIDDFTSAMIKNSENKNIFESPRSIHFLLKPVEDGLNEIEQYPPPISISENLDLIPGRLSIHKYENKIAERWSGAYQSDNLSIRTITNIRRICEKYADIYKYDFIIVDTSPSLGILNKTIISTVDGFIVPTQPDMFSLYGIRNIGNSLKQWQNEFNIIFSLISESKRNKFPDKFVHFLGYTIYNAKKYGGINCNNPYELAAAHYAYTLKIPGVIDEFIDTSNRAAVTNIMEPIGHDAVIHSHNTFPSIAQALKCPIWKIPEVFRNLEIKNPEYLKELEIEVNRGHYGKMRETKDKYMNFATDFLVRCEVL